jgi:hypothetical protein
MAEPQLPADELDDYLLGRLTPAARRQFEQRLAADAALRQRARELEEGMLALAMSAPQLKAPTAAWANIEAAIAPPPRNIFSFWKLNWLTGGLALAVCMAVGFFIHALSTSPTAGKKIISNNSSGNLAVSTPAGQASLPKAQTTNGAFGAASSKRKSPSTTPGTNETQLTQSSTPGDLQGGAVISALRLSGPSGTVAHGQARLSPKTQQAVLLAVARQMGWSAESTKGAGVPVDFVDLPDATAPVLALGALPGDAQTMLPDLAALPSDPANEVPIVAWGDKLFVTIDPAAFPTDAGPVVVWSLDNNGNQGIVGTVPLGSNPLVITISTANNVSPTTYFVTVGGTNLFGRYPPAD